MHAIPTRPGIAATLLVALCLALPAAAERRANANEPIVISDDIQKRTTAVRSANRGRAGPRASGAAFGEAGDPPPAPPKTRAPGPKREVRMR